MFGFFLDTIKPWFLTERKFAAVLIIPSSWGSQLDGEKPSTPCRIIEKANGLICNGIKKEAISAPGKGQTRLGR
jgi:hypothetical protein